MLIARTFHGPPRTAKSAVWQAFRRGNLRGKRGKRNAALQLCTAKQLFGPAANRHQAPHFRLNFIMTQVDHSGMANAIRGLAMDAVEKAKSGHPGLPMGAADVATVLFTQFLKFDAADSKWPDRDRFVLSAGHGSMLLYALLYLTGNPDMTPDQLKHFRQLGSLTPGHPENFHTKGIETTTGPLGQGIATSVGM